MDRLEGRKAGVGGKQDLLHPLTVANWGEQ